MGLVGSILKTLERTPPHPILAIDKIFPVWVYRFAINKSDKVELCADAREGAKGGEYREDLVNTPPPPPSERLISFRLVCNF